MGDERVAIRSYTFYEQQKRLIYVACDNYGLLINTS